eukprot:1170907-Pleurochrysis_carterae.AAC.1
MAMARVSRAHGILELFDCLSSVACMGVCVKSTDVSGILVWEVSCRCDELMQFFGSWAMSVSGFAKVVTRLAGAKAGCGLGAGAGVSVVASRLSFTSRRRCSRTWRNSRVAVASSVTPALKTYARQFGQPSTSQRISLS